MEERRGLCESCVVSASDLGFNVIPLLLVLDFFFREGRSGTSDVQ